jgi:hypothetical protein
MFKDAEVPPVDHHEGLSESSRTRLNTSDGLIYSILAAISSRLVSLRTYATIPSFFPRF